MWVRWVAGVLQNDVGEVGRWRGGRFSNFWFGGFTRGGGGGWGYVLAFVCVCVCVFFF